VNARATIVSAAPRAGEADASAVVFARAMDEPGFRGSVADELRSVLAEGEAIGFPAVLGLRDAPRAWRDLEERLGSARFIALYLGAGVIASLAHAVFNLSSTIPALGASGAIAGVIAAYALSFPHAWIRVLVLLIFIPLFFYVPALVFAGLWFLMQVLQGTTSLFLPAQGGGIAWWAHIGGMVTGAILILFMRRPGVPLFDRGLPV